MADERTTSHLRLPCNRNFKLEDDQLVVSVRLHGGRTDYVSPLSAIQLEFQTIKDQLIVSVRLHGGLTN